MKNSISESGACPPNCENLFHQIFVLYSPERIKAIRESLEETREEFGQRFFVAEDTVKCWELKEGSVKHRELPGPAARLMLLVESEALKKRDDKNKILMRLITRHNKTLAKRFEHILSGGM